MPGIVGIIGSEVDAHADDIHRMVDAMLHEPFYTSGTHVDDAIGLQVGWVQRRGSFSDCVPVWNEARDACLIFQGELFASNDSRAGLQQSIGTTTRGKPSLVGFDGDVLAFLRSLNGWFSGVLIDVRRAEAVLFNDRYGLQRIYYCERDGTLYFASEAKSLLKVLPELRELDMQSLAEVMSFGCALEDRTLFKGISLVPPASAWTLARGRVQHRSKYFLPACWADGPRLSTAEFYPRLRETVRKVVPNYVASGEPVGMSLTGGLDTRMILANLDLAPGQLPCYSFGGMYNESYDVAISRDIAKRCGQDYQVLQVGESFLANFPALAEKAVYITDGGLDVTGAADLYVNQLARRIAPVRLTGNYGSEILRGARHLKAVPPAPNLFEPAFEREIARAPQTLKTVWQGDRVALAAFKQAPWHHYNRLCVEQSQLTVRSPFLDNALVDLMAKAPASALDSAEISLQLIRDGNPQLAEVMTDRGIGGNGSQLHSRATHLYREFLFKADYAFNYGMPQWLAKLDRFTIAPLRAERLFLGRHKFHHFRVWFRDELSPYVRDVLLDRRSVTRPYLRERALETLVRAHIEGRANHTTEITKLLTAELVQRQLLEQ